MKNIAIIILVIFSIGAFAQSAEQKRNQMLGKRYAELELKKALTETIKITTGERQTELKDSISAIKAAEKFLFKEYGKQTIQNQKPYEIYLIRDYWVILGTFFKNQAFLIILDKRTSTIIKHKMRILK